MVLWSILIPTLSTRTGMLAELLGVLLPQAEADGRVEVVGLFNHGDRPVGWYRQRLLDEATGEYVSFVDDDDTVDLSFVPLITAAMAKRPDYVSFEQAYYVDGIPQPVRILNGLQYLGRADGYANDGVHELARAVTHVNPCRAALARQARFDGTRGSGEDSDYVGRLAPLLWSQAIAGGVLYHYRHRPADSVQHALAGGPVDVRPVIDSPCFRWIGENQ